MLTVAILINGHPLVAKSAVNLQETNEKGLTKYRADDGTIILHDQSDGAVVLSKKLLDLIKNSEVPK